MAGLSPAQQLFAKAVFCEADKAQQGALPCWALFLCNKTAFAKAESLHERRPATGPAVVAGTTTTETRQGWRVDQVGICVGSTGLKSWNKFDKNQN
jgi:hypothetical protein